MSWNSSTKHYQIQSPIPQTCLTTTNKTLSINDVVFSIYWLLGQTEVYWLHWQFTFVHVRELEIKGYVFTCLSVHTIIPWRCGHQIITTFYCCLSKNVCALKWIYSCTCLWAKIQIRQDFLFCFTVLYGYLTLLKSLFRYKYSLPWVNLYMCL